MPPEHVNRPRDPGDLRDLWRPTAAALRALVKVLSQLSADQVGGRRGPAAAAEAARLQEGEAAGVDRKPPNK